MSHRTGTLLAAHALVASFLGATTIRETGLEACGWIALGSLVAGLVAAAILLAPWNLKFLVDAKQLYDELYEQAAGEAEADTLGGLPRLATATLAKRERAGSRQSRRGFVRRTPAPRAKRARVEEASRRSLSHGRKCGSLTRVVRRRSFA